MPTENSPDFNETIRILMVHCGADPKRHDFGIRSRTLKRLLENGIISDNHNFIANEIWKAAVEGFQSVLRDSPNKNPESHPELFEIIGDPKAALVASSSKWKAFEQKAKQARLDYLKRIASEEQLNPSDHMRSADGNGASHQPEQAPTLMMLTENGVWYEIARSAGTGIPKAARALDQNEGPLSPLTLWIHSPTFGFLCAQSPTDAKLLKESDHLPLPHNAIGQLHVRFEQPSHFCLFAISPERTIEAYVPHEECPVGQPRIRLTIPGDICPGNDEIPFEGPGGIESFLLLVSHQALTKADAFIAQSAIAKILSAAGPIRLHDTTLAFVASEPLAQIQEVPTTKGFWLDNAQPFSDPLQRFLAEVRDRLSGSFSELHFIGVRRSDPPHANEKHS